jgi:hypothetical protein
LKKEPLIKASSLFIAPFLNIPNKENKDLKGCSKPKGDKTKTYVKIDNIAINLRQETTLDSIKKDIKNDLSTIEENIKNDLSTIEEKINTIIKKDENQEDKAEDACKAALNFMIYGISATLIFVCIEEIVRRAIVQALNPIGIALENGKEIELIGLNDSGTYFDYNNDGLRNKTSWVGAKDAILFYDYNHTQQADDFKKIVMTAWSKLHAKTDFLAFIEVFLTQDNMVFDRLNKHFSDFYLWLDKNSNGQVDAEELVSLENAGIQRIEFNTMRPVQDTQGGSILNVAEVKWKNG